MATSGTPAGTGNGDLQDALARAAEAGFDVLRNLARTQLDAGRSLEELHEALLSVRGLVDERSEDTVLDVMDLLVGWCAPGARVADPGEST